MRMRALLALVVFVLGSACGGGRRHAPEVRVIVRLGSHQLVFRAEVAADPLARGRGLMFRKAVPAGTGMLFLFPSEVREPFYMKDTLVPLDIGWIRRGRLVEIAHMQPCRAAPCPLWTPRTDYDQALETRVGGLTGVDAGATVQVFGAVPTPS